MGQNAGLASAFRAISHPARVVVAVFARARRGVPMTAPVSFRPLPSYLALAILILAAAGLATPARADWVHGQAQRVFGPDTAQTDACRDATNRARAAALRARLGERLSSEDLMVCTDKAHKGACSLNRAIWSTVDGAIRAVRDKRVVVRPGPVAGFQTCIVSLEADVGVAIGHYDPSFDLGVTMNEHVFRPGDTLTLTITPTQPMHIAVFQWLPYRHTGMTVTRIFPNRYDTDDLFTRPGTIPTAAGATRYAMRLKFPGGMPPSRQMVDEYLMIVATKKKVDFRESYTLDEFRGRLLEIPRNVSRLIRRAYSVVRGPGPTDAGLESP